jgi:hypothetical protein
VNNIINIFQFLTFLTLLRVYCDVTFADLPSHSINICLRIAIYIALMATPGVTLEGALEGALEGVLNVLTLNVHTNGGAPTHKKSTPRGSMLERYNRLAI